MIIESPSIEKKVLHYLCTPSLPNQFSHKSIFFVYLSYKNFQIKKTRTKLSKKEESSKKNRKCLRSTIDLPKAALDYDVISYYSTDEDNLDGLENVTKPQRQQLRGELKRSLHVVTPKVMPPELIITPAQKNGDEFVREYKDEKSQVIISELPPIGRIQQSNSWHNFKKCVPTMK